MATKMQRRSELARLMDTHGLTSEDVHALTGYHAVVIRQWKSGSKAMSPRASRLCRVLIEAHANGLKV